MRNKDRSFSLNQLHYFVMVAKHLNYRKAAQSLGISQPTLTSQINALEAQLDITLFERSRTGTYLSSQGRALLPVAEETLRAAARVEETAQLISDGENTTYRLGVPPTLGPYLLPHIFPELHKQFPHLKFYVREAAPLNLYQGLLNDEYDIIISPMSSPSSQVMTHPLFSEPLKFVIASDHPLSGKQYVRPEDIEGERVLTLEDTHHFHYQVLEICDELKADLQRDYEGTSLDTLRQMVVMGMGAAFLPGLYVHSELHDPEAVHVCEIENKPIIREHMLAWRNTSPSRTFFRILANRIQSLVAQKLADAVILDAEPGEH